MKKTNQTEFRIEKVIKEKRKVHCISSGRVMKICLIVWFIYKISIYKLSFYLKPDSCDRNKIKAQLDLSNYAIKSDVRNAKSVNTSEFAEKMIYLT